MACIHCTWIRVLPNLESWVVCNRGIWKLGEKIERRREESLSYDGGRWCFTVLLHLFPTAWLCFGCVGMWGRMRHIKTKTGERRRKTTRAKLQGADKAACTMPQEPAPLSHLDVASRACACLRVHACMLVFVWACLTHRPTNVHELPKCTCIISYGWECGRVWEWVSERTCMRACNARACIHPCSSACFCVCLWTCMHAHVYLIRWYMQYVYFECAILSHVCEKVYAKQSIEKRS